MGKGLGTVVHNWNPSTGEKLRQEDHPEIEVSLDYIVRLSLKNQKREQGNKHYKVQEKLKLVRIWRNCKVVQTLQKVACPSSRVRPGSPTFGYIHKNWTALLFFWGGSQVWTQRSSYHSAIYLGFFFLRKYLPELPGWDSSFWFSCLSLSQDWDYRQALPQYTYNLKF